MIYVLSVMTPWAPLTSAIATLPPSVFVSALTWTKVPVTPPTTGARNRITVAWGSTPLTLKTGAFDGLGLLSHVVCRKPCDESLAGLSTGALDASGAEWSILMVKALLGCEP